MLSCADVVRVFVTGCEWERRAANEASGGRGGIRTHEGADPLPVFKTGALNHSATLPSFEILSEFFVLLPEIPKWSPKWSPTPVSLIEPCRSIALHSLTNVGVKVHRRGYGRAPKALLHDLGMHPRA
jgi:hypothetical protein